MNTRFSHALAFLTAITFATAGTVQAQAFGTNCTAPTNVYGGTGIPTANSMCGTVGAVNMYLGVSPRYTSPAPTTDGNGNWWAQPGPSTGAPVNTGFATWNFNFASTGAASTDFFRLTINGVGLTPLAFDFSDNYGDSSNLGYLAAFGFSNADGKTYTFRLDLYGDNSRVTSLGHVAEVVNVVPEPSTYALMAAGFAALGLIARRRKATSTLA